MMPGENRREKKIQQRSKIVVTTRRVAKTLFLGGNNHE
jgi:hypothetical protein